MRGFRNDDCNSSETGYERVALERFQCGASCTFGNTSTTWRPRNGEGAWDVFMEIRPDMGFESSRANTESSIEQNLLETRNRNCSKIWHRLHHSGKGGL